MRGKLKIVQPHIVQHPISSAQGDTAILTNQKKSAYQNNNLHASIQMRGSLAA